MAVCSTYDPDCYGCRLRAKGVGIDPAATPTRTRNRVPTQVFAPRNSWEAGVAGEHRPDGSFMPYQGADGYPMGVKEHAERRHEVTEKVRRLKSTPA
jgi:hypothetical protein